MQNLLCMTYYLSKKNTFYCFVAFFITILLLFLVKFEKGEEMDKLTRVTLRIPQTMQNKIQYTAQYNCRSKNKEIEMAIKRYLNDFERLHGNIETKTHKE